MPFGQYSWYLIVLVKSLHVVQQALLVYDKYHFLTSRGMSSAHAIYITSVSIYLVFFNNLFSDQLDDGPITLRYSNFSTITLGVILKFSF
jgi:hypothetical protein